MLRFLRAFSSPRPVHFVSDSHREIVRAQRCLFDNVRELLDPLLDPSPLDLKTIQTAIHSLNDLFYVTVIGEFNSGKSTFINALLGERLCEEGVTPTTSSVKCIRFDDALLSTKASLTSKSRLSWLKDAVIVDTPGTNAIIAGHQEITENIIPRSDLVFFLTSVDRPFSESERMFISKIYEWRRKIVFIVNKIDMLDAETRSSDLEKVISFIRSNIQQQLQLDLPIFAVSGKMALDYKLLKHQDFENGFDALEEFICRTLSDTDKLRLKLENPLGIIQQLLKKYNMVVQARQKSALYAQTSMDCALKELEISKLQIRSSFHLQTSRITSVLVRLLHRVDDFLSEQLRVSNIANLLNTSQLANSFDQHVKAEFTSEINNLITDISGWLREQVLAQVQLLSFRDHDNATMTTCSYAPLPWTSQDLGQISTLLLSKSQGLQSNLRLEVISSLQRYDNSQVTQELVGAIRHAIFATFTLEVSALFAAILTTAKVDPSGVFSVIGLALSGLIVLPYKKRELGRQTRQQIMGLQHQLESILEQYLESEFNRSSSVILNALHPHISRNKSELDLLDVAADKIQQLKQDVNKLRSMINSRCGAKSTVVWTNATDPTGDRILYP